jgi:hypothetical protein
VPDLLVRRLTEAGVPEATIGAAERFGDRYAGLEEIGPAARAWLRGPPGRPLGDAPRRPPTWLLDLAAPWLHAQAPPGTTPVGLVISVELALDWPTLVPDLAPTLDSQTPVAAVATDFGAAVSAIAVGDAFRDTLPQASLTAAGRDWSGVELAARMTGLRDLIRAHAPALVWAGVTAERGARGLRSAAWTDPESGPVRPDAAHLPDLLMPDGMWCHVLSEGRLERLGGLPDSARWIADGRVELTVGAPEQWLPGHPDRPALQARARELLHACLVSGPDVAAMTAARGPADRGRDSVHGRHDDTDGPRAGDADRGRRSRPARRCPACLSAAGGAVRSRSPRPPRVHTDTCASTMSTRHPPPVSLVLCALPGAPRPDGWSAEWDQGDRGWRAGPTCLPLLDSAR